MLRCIFCGYCEDACPTEAIVLGEDYELSFYDRASSIYTKEMLIEPVQGDAKATPQTVTPGAFDRSIPDMADPK
jgi:NADH-quinone oxidoreductase subunit I